LHLGTSNGRECFFLGLNKFIVFGGDFVNVFLNSQSRIT